MRRRYGLLIASLSLLVLLGGCESKNIENEVKEKEKEEVLRRVTGVYSGILKTEGAATLEVYREGKHLRLRGRDRWSKVELRSSMGVETFTGEFLSGGYGVLLVCEFFSSEKKVRVFETGDGAFKEEIFEGRKR